MRGMANSGPIREHDGHAQHQSETFGHPGAQIAESARLRHDDHAEDRQSHCGDDETDHAHECAIAGESPEIGGKDEIAGTEEHREERDAHDDALACVESLMRMRIQFAHVCSCVPCVPCVSFPIVPAYATDLCTLSEENVPVPYVRF